PYHILATLPATCLLGAFVISVTENNYSFDWLSKNNRRGTLAVALMVISSFLLLYAAEQPRQKWLVIWAAMLMAFLLLLPRRVAFLPSWDPSAGRGMLACLALMTNIFLFFAEISIPNRTPTTRFR